MKKLLFVPCAMLAVNLTACTNSKTLRDVDYYLDHLSEAENLSKQCEKEGIGRDELKKFSKEEIEAKTEKVIKAANCYMANFTIENQENLLWDRERKAKEKIEVDKIKAEIKRFDGKDQLYYFTHLDEAKKRSEYCRNNEELYYDMISFSYYSSNYEERYQLSKENSVYAQNFNLKVFQLKDCSFAKRAIESEELRQEWWQKQTKDEASDKVRAEKINEVKKALEKKYADMSWQEFYAFAKEKENVAFLYTNSSAREQDTRAAIEKILFDKGKPFINALIKKDFDKLITDLPESCKDDFGVWWHDPSCILYAKALEEKFLPLIPSVFSKFNKKYKYGPNDDHNIISTSYFSAASKQSDEERKVLMKDYRKLYSAQKKCVAKITDEINQTTISHWSDYSSSYFFENDYICSNVNWVMKELDLPDNLEHITDRLLYKKVYPDGN